MMIQCDVLVIGDELAACRAAIEAHDSGASVQMVLKGKFGTTGTSAYYCNSADSIGDRETYGLLDLVNSLDIHFSEIMRTAAGMSDPKLARILVEESNEHKRYLETFHIPFLKRDNRNYFEGFGSTAAKTHKYLVFEHYEDAITNEFKRKIIERNIPVNENILITRLIVENNRIAGAFGFNLDGKMVTFNSKAVILGTGGAGHIFPGCIDSPAKTGDGYSLGFRAGAKLVNMEYTQAEPWMIYPRKIRFDPNLWALYPKIRNGLGEEFIHKYVPEGMTVGKCMDLRSGHVGFTSSDVSRWIDIAIHTEIKEGRAAAHGGVIVDFTNVSEDSLPNNERGQELRKSWNITLNWLIENRKLDLRKTPIEVAILGHTINGGLLIDEKAETTIKGLFAAGETAGGLLGANQLWGSKVLTGLVFGKRAGIFAVYFAHQHEMQDFPQHIHIKEKENIPLFSAMKQKSGAIKSQQFKKELQDIISRYALVTRSEESLTTAINRIKILQENLHNVILITDERELVKAIEMDNMLLVSEIILRAARVRQESRGSHFRADHTEQNDEDLLYRIVSSLGDKGIEHSPLISHFETVTEYPYHKINVNG